MNYSYQKMKSPIGNLYLVADADALCGIYFQKHWPEEKRRMEGIREGTPAVLKQAKRQLSEYFAGKRKSFDLPLSLSGTPFQKRVWLSLSNIPFGQTRSYKQQAQSVHSPKATRAVGRTNGLNPLCIVLPCHRVIGSDGSLTGYAGGLHIKKFLLQLEKESANN